MEVKIERKEMVFCKISSQKCIHRLQIKWIKKPESCGKYKHRIHNIFISVQLITVLLNRLISQFNCVNKLSNIR